MPSLDHRTARSITQRISPNSEQAARPQHELRIVGHLLDREPGAGRGAERRQDGPRAEVVVLDGRPAQHEQRDMDADEDEQQQQDGRVGERRQVAEDDQHGGDRRR